MEIIEVNKENFKEEVIDSKIKVLVDFNAKWCGPCRMLKPILSEYAKENENIKIASINVDNNIKLSNEYQVSSIPCLVLFSNGQETRRTVGLLSKEELKKFIGEE